jgi:hypothetical protein
MPYITKEIRELAKTSPTMPGELNFAISTLIDNYITTAGGLNYGNINEVIGVLECAKLELYRRLAAPYEEIKKAQNGDVYKTKVPGYVRPISREPVQGDI